MSRLSDRSGRVAGRLVDLLARGLEGWTGRVRRHGGAVVVVAAAVTAGLGWYAATSLGIDTETQDMFSSRLSWRQDQDRYLATFPHAGHTLLVVIDGETPDAADAAQLRLARRMGARPELFGTVYVPGGEPFFRRNGLLFSSVPELEATRDRLAEFAPWLRRLEASPTLPTFAAVLDSTMEAERYRDDLDLAPFLGMVGRTFQAKADRQAFQVAWSDLLRGRRSDREDRRRFITVNPVLDYGRARPGKEAVATVRSLVKAFGWDREPAVEVRLTGRVAMQDEEIRSVSRGAALAGVLALLLVGGVLHFGLRSRRLILASMAALVAGLTATAAFAALAVGRLNLISVAFAVLYIGLGIDYAVHLGLRYRELRADGRPHGEAMARAVRDVGPSLCLSAVTTALAFYAFVPTDFTGIAELGLISGTGMFLSLVATVTLMPALLELSPLRADAAGAARRGDPGEVVSRLARLPVTRPRTVVWGGVGLGALSLLLLPTARFDPDPLHLRDPGTESVATYLELLESPRTTPLTIELLRPTAEAARTAAEDVAELEAVRSGRTLGDFVPGEQEEKLAILEEIREVLGATGPTPADPAPPRPGGRTDTVRPVPGPGTATGLDEGRRAVERLRRGILEFLPFAGEEERRRGNYALLQIARWRGVVARWPEPERDSFVRELERSLLGSLPGRLRRLREGLEAGPVTLADLPDELVRRWRSPDGWHRVEVAPEENLARPAALDRFVTEVRTEFPDATGPPVVRYQAGVVAVRAFRRALLLASAAALVVLLLALGSLSATATVLLPLVVAGLVTVAVTVVLGLPFNFANIIALPLLLGVGLDNGIHMVHRSRMTPPGEVDLLRTSTARAVVVSFLTTIFSFGNLAFSPHRGMASMGRLLAVGMAAALAATVLLLPALLRTTASRGPGPAQPAEAGRRPHPERDRQT